MATRQTHQNYGQSLTQHFSYMKKAAPETQVRATLLGAKSSLLGKNHSLPLGMRQSMVKGYRVAEHHLFKSVTTLPGEQELLHSQLPKGLNLGQRVSARRAAMRQANPPQQEEQNPSSPQPNRLQSAQEGQMKEAWLNSLSGQVQENEGD